MLQLGRIKASGLNDRKRHCVELIRCLLRSFNRKIFHASQLKYLLLPASFNLSGIAIVNVLGRRIESQIQFWSLLGPFFLLLSVAVLIFKISAHWYFPLTALFGIPLCVKWRMKGMAAALCCLFLLSALSYQSLELDERYWHVGLTLAMAFSMIVMTLSLEEGEGLVSNLQRESQSRLDNCMLLDEKWKAAEREWVLEREKAKMEVFSLSQEALSLQDSKQTHLKLAQLAKEELLHFRVQHELLLQDLHYKKLQTSQLQERLEEMDVTIHNFVNSDSEKQIESLTDRAEILEKEKEALTLELQSNKKREQEFSADQARIMQVLEKEKEIAEANYALVLEERMVCQKEKETLTLELQSNKKREQEFSADQARIMQVHEKEKETAEANYARVLEARLECQKKNEALTLELELYREKELEFKADFTRVKQEMEERQRPVLKSSANTRSVEAMYNQLSQQFQEKCEVLNATRRELFAVNELLYKAKKEYEESHVYDQPDIEKKLQRHIGISAKQFEQMCTLFQQEIDELHQVIGCLLKQINHPPAHK